MMKQLPELSSTYPASEKEQNDMIPGSKEMEPFTDPAQLPITLNANQVAGVLGISRAGAYNLMRSEGFPTLFIGKRMVVPKDRLLAWMNAKIGA